MANRISARAGAIAPSATLSVDTAAKALRAQGRPVISFGTGEPDFPTPAAVVEAAQRACAEPRFQRYSAAAGLPELREAVAAATAHGSGYPAEAANVLIANGGKHAVEQACATILDPGDEMLVISPYWTTYPEAVRLAGGVPVTVETDASTGFLAPVQALERMRTPRTKALIFVSPSNPTGAVYPAAQVAEIGRWAAERGLWVLTDEIYSRLVYGDAEFTGIAAQVPELHDRLLIVSGVAKTYAMTGWRVGWLVGPRDVVQAATNLQSHTTSNVCNVAQAAAHAALTGDLEAEFAAMHAAFDRRRRLIVGLLDAIDGIDCPTPHGAFYAFPSVRALLGREIRGRRPATSAEFVDLVLHETEVALVPGEAFGAPGYVRFSYALGDDDLVEGVSRIAKLLAA